MTPNDSKPIAAVEDDGRFTLTSHADVVFLLTQMLRRGELFTVYFNSGKDFLLTSILDIENGRFVFDLGSDPGSNERILKAERLVFVAAPDGVRLQFVTVKPKRVSFGEYEAFSAPLPSELVKLQRRESFRVETPHRDPLQMVFPSGPQGRLVLPLRNLSIGGAGLELPNEKHGFSLLQRYFETHIDLGENGRIYSDVQVKHITQHHLRNDRMQLIIGVQFVTLSKVEQAKLQRFLVYLERERRQLSL